MLDVVVLNRNLGSVCDRLVDDLIRRGVEPSNICVVEASSNRQLRSSYSSVTTLNEESIKFGLRFRRGMNLGIQWFMNRGLTSEWLLLLPVDTEIRHMDLDNLEKSLKELPGLAAFRPLEEESGYRPMLQTNQLALAWNVEEGPMGLRWAFVRDQLGLRPDGNFFDPSNFRGFLTWLEVAFRCYANDLAVGLTSHLVVRENERLLLEWHQLIETEPLDENLQLMVEEGAAWLGEKFGISDPWSFAEVVRLLHESYVRRHPEVSRFVLEEVSGDH